MILITLALVSYSTGVWSERIAGRLRGWHLIFFWMGLFFDTMGTGIMMEMGGHNNRVPLADRRGRHPADVHPRSLGHGRAAAEG